MNIVSDSISICPMEQTISIYTSLFQHTISGLLPKLYTYKYIYIYIYITKSTSNDIIPYQIINSKSNIEHS